MPNFTATVTLQDGKKRQTTKRYETKTDVLATAQLAVLALAADLLAVSDLGIVTVTYSLGDDTEASSAEATSNVDVGATFRCRLNNTKVAAHKVPGFPMAKVAPGGSIDVTDADVAAYFANFESAGEFTVSEGNHIIELLSGQLDK